MSAVQTFWEKLDKFDPRYIWGVFLISMVAFVFVPSRPAVVVTPNVQIAYDFVDKLKTGDVVVFETANSFGYYISHIPGAVAVLNHALTKKVRLIMFTAYDDGALIWRYVMIPNIAATLEKYGYEYGKDWVELGFIAGRETGVSAFTNNVKVFAQDSRGNPTENMPVLKDVKNAGDFKLWIQAGNQHMWVIRQAWAKFKTPIIEVSHAGGLASLPTFVQAGQMIGFIHGWEGGAMYEYLSARAGLGSTGLVLLSVAYIVTLGFLIIGNITLAALKLVARGRRR